MQGFKYFFIFFILTVIFSCNSPYDQMLNGLGGQEFCLTKAEYDNGDTLLLGTGTLTLNKDQTFTIKTDSTIGIKLIGNWDLCCKNSDYGNYIFKVDKLPEWKQSDPNLFVLINGKKVRLFFGSCPNYAKEVFNDRLLYKKIALLGTTPFDISNSTTDELKNHLLSNENDSLRVLLKAKQIEFHIDSSNMKFGLDSVVVFQKDSYYVLYDISKRKARLTERIDSSYKEKVKLIDTNLYLIEE